MSKSSRPKEKYGKSSGLSLDNCEEGTAARTRPFSFEEIMLRRENKKLSENAKEGAIEVANKAMDDIVENISDRFESERGHRQNKGSSSGVEKHVSEEFVKVSSWKKEENTSVKEQNLAKGKDREIRDSKTKSKTKQDNGMNNKAKGDKTDKQVHGRRTYRERSSDDSENEAKRKHSRDVKDRYADSSRGKSERESKRKYQKGDDEKNRDRNAAKEHDLGKRHDLEISEKKERKESSKSRYEESKPKRRRSRSREREDRSRKSISVSPRAHKRTSYHGREHGELSSHSFKDRSGRQHSDVDRSRISSNGSSSHYRRHGGSTRRLGGYSPRKRKTEAAIKTPSPPNRSPEKKSAGWDLPPARSDSSFSGQISSNFLSSNQTISSNVNELVSAVPVVSTIVKPISVVSSDALSTKKNVSLDSVQLTQSTRPMRRLYVENIPASASEKAVMECLNNFLLSSGVNHIQGFQPCISCTIHKEKGQALLEFLTPEDASSALSFDGSSFSGSILKIRRPKDFIEVATDDLGKSVATVDATSDAAVGAISDIVKDSPHKIFIGGISKSLSSEMLMEIASAFGTLKAYHFEVNEDLKEPCAFMEYVDQLITLKACAGLNGMKLGGQVLTAVQAVPNASSSENTGSQPFYGIPEHAKSLLKQPSQVLKLKNVFNPEGLTSLSEPEVEEVLEDIRLECARFGTIKSINVIKYSDSHIVTSEAREVIDNTGSARTWQNLGYDDRDARTETMEEVIDHESRGISGARIPSNVKEIREVDKVAEGNCINDDRPADDLPEDKSCQPGEVDSNMAVEDLACENVPDRHSQIPDQLNPSKDQSEFHDEKVADIVQTSDAGMKNKLVAEDELTSEEANSKLQEAFAGSGSCVGTESDIIEKGDNKEQDCNLGHVFEPGCVYVEYGRTEASCMAARCLHQRLFVDRIVTVEYVALDIYRARFPK